MRDSVRLSESIVWSVVWLDTGRTRRPLIFRKMTAEERTAYMNKMRAASQEDWQRMMDKLGLKLPTLPPPADDPKRSLPKP